MRRLRALVVSAVVSAGLLVGVVVAPSALADTSLCSGAGYSTCVNAGYTDHGYVAHSGTSYWGAYTGHNCTNYVAYVESTVNGAATPGDQLGDADTWYGNAAAHGVAVNATPANGAVAWWDAAYWNGNAGHVAYVESVNSDGSITVSEDAYSSGPFDWRTIMPGSAGWPGGFIHFKDLAGGSGAAGYLIARSGTTVYGKQGLTDTWSTLTAGTSVDVQAAGSRIAFVDGSGNLYAKDGLGGVWYQEIGSVSQYVVTPGYLVVRVGGTVYAKAGLTDTWTTLTTGATDIQAAGTRIAFVDGSGTLYVKDTIGGVWTQEAGGFNQYVVTSSYVIVRWGGSTISGKAGLNDMWSTLVAGSATDVKAQGTRIAFLDNTNTLWAKDGLGGTWSQETSSVSQYVVTPQLLLARSGSTVYGKQGLGDMWVTLTAGTATDVRAAGSRIAFVDGSGDLYAKDGLGGVWYQEIGSISQYAVTTTGA